MQDHQWELAADDGQPGFLFGTADTGIQTATAPDLGVRDVDSSDRGRPREDGIGFGPDFERGRTITFECNVLTSGWAEQSDLLNQFDATWSNKRFRRDSDAYAVLRSHAAGRTRRCYGRPRRFGETDGDLTHEGFTGVVCDFRTFDRAFYDEAVNTETVPIRAPSSRGFTTPIIVTGTDPNTVAFQTETLDPSEIPGDITVTGADTWVWVTVHGPVTGPLVVVGDLLLGLDYTIPDGMSVTFDPRPWSRGVRRSDGANLSKHLTWDTPPMQDWQIPAGSHQIVYRGDDATGTSFTEVQWRTAHTRP